LKFKFPDTGEGVTEGQFLEWKISEGEKVEEDQIVGEAETDKAVVDIPAPADGFVDELKVSPGDNVQVGDVIMILDEGSEKPETENKASEEKDKTKDPNTEDPETDSNGKKDAVMGGSPSASSYYDEEQENTQKEDEPSDSSKGDVLALPKVRKLAEEKGVELGKLNIDGRITEEDVLEASGSKQQKKTREQEKEPEEKHEPENNQEEDSRPQDMSDVDARPSVRKLAREHDIEISVLEGSGRNGEVTREDVLEAAGEETEEISTEKEEKIQEEPKERPKIQHEGDVERIEMSGIRKATADKMAHSKDKAAHVTHIEKVDITELVELRESVKNEVDAHLTYLPFIMKACVAGLREYPKLNSELNEENNEIIKKNFYNFNIAVDTDRGLLVPRIDGVDEKNMVELAEDIGDKASRAQEGDLEKEEMEPGTFSITNLGVIGGEAFTPIIYPPQSAILGIGKIQETAEVVDGEVVPRKTVKLSLSYDHRVVDGAEAARFMKKVVKDLENPREMLVDI